MNKLGRLAEEFKFDRVKAKEEKRNSDTIKAWVKED